MFVRVLNTPLKLLILSTSDRTYEKDIHMRFRFNGIIVKRHNIELFGGNKFTISGPDIWNCVAD